MIRTKVEPLEKDIDLIFSQELSPTARSKMLADFAQEKIGEAKDINRRALGRDPPMTTFVDGRQGAPLTSVRPDGVIVAEFKLIDEVLIWIAEQLETHSPVKRGTYKKSHVLLADGQQIDPRSGNIPSAEEYVFINTQPYARKIESGSSSQAPDGVYQAVAILSRRFGNMAKVSFGYRVPLFGAVHSWAQTTSSGKHRKSDRAEWLRRQPAIIVKVR